MANDDLHILRTAEIQTLRKLLPAVKKLDGDVRKMTLLVEFYVNDKNRTYILIECKMKLEARDNKE